MRYRRRIATRPLRHELLARLAPSNAFQPATMLWRIFELEAVLVQPPLRGRGVDIGCGDGELGAVVFGAMRPRPTAIIGIDPSARDCALARTSGTYAAVHQTTGDRLPFAAGELDFAFSNSTLEHIPAIEPVIAEVARVLRPDGTFLFTVPSEEFHRCLRGQPLIAALARRRGRSYGEAVDERLAHERYLDPAAWSALLGAHRLRVTRVVRYFPRPAVRAWERLSSLTGGLAYELIGLAGRGRATREIQHDLGLARRPPWPLARGSALATRLAGRSALDADVRPGEPSGGLLVIATRD